MSAELPNDGGAAFPLGTVDGYCTDGMSLRDYFAAAALTGLVASPRIPGTTDDSATRITAELYADLSYKIADAMLKACYQNGGEHER